MPAFNPDIHDIDPKTGFQIDKETGVMSGLVAKPHAPVSAERDWPAWVPVHESHVVRVQVGDAPAHISTPDYVDFHVNRVTGEVTVLVNNEEEERRATSGKEPSPAPVADPVDHHSEEV